MQAFGCTTAVLSGLYSSTLEALLQSARGVANFAIVGLSSLSIFRLSCKFRLLPTLRILSNVVNMESEVLQTDGISRLAELMSDHDDEPVLLREVTRAVGNLSVTGSASIVYWNASSLLVPLNSGCLVTFLERIAEEIRDVDATSILVQLLSHEDKEIRDNAQFTLSNMMGRDAMLFQNSNLTELSDLLDHNDEVVRCLAIQSLAELSADRFVSMLALFLSCCISLFHIG